MITCTNCTQPVDPLEVFPNNLCLTCYADTPAGKRMPTAEELIKMWSK